MSNIQNKVIIITGGLGLLGRSLAEKLAKDKGIIIILDVKTKEHLVKMKDYKLIKKNLY